MKTAKDILLENIPKDCWWEEMENLTNTPVEYVTKAMESFAAQSVREDRESRWISVKTPPDIGKDVWVCLNDDTILMGKLLNDGWVAFFQDGLLPMIERRVTHWQPLPSPPTNKG